LARRMRDSHAKIHDEVNIYSFVSVRIAGVHLGQPGSPPSFHTRNQG